MELSFKELFNLRDDKVYEFDDVTIEVENNTFLRRLKDLNGYIAFYPDASDQLIIEYEFEGKMVCPDSFTLEDVELPFSYDTSEPVSTSELEDGFYIYDHEDIEKLVLSIVLPDVPIKVENIENVEYYSGDGWALVSEEEFLDSQKDAIDPRFEKLMEFKEE